MKSTVYWGKPLETQFVLILQVECIVEGEDYKPIFTKEVSRESGEIFNVCINGLPVVQCGQLNGSEALAGITTHPFRYDRPAGKAGCVDRIKLIHQVSPVHLYGLQAEPQTFGNILGCAPLSYHLQNF